MENVKILLDVVNKIFVESIIPMGIILIIFCIILIIRTKITKDESCNVKLIHKIVWGEAR